MTSAPMESFVRQVNLRVKGAEMFWDDPEGTEALLQLRAAALSEDDHLDRFLTAHPGHPFACRSTRVTAAQAEIDPRESVQLQ